MLRYFAENNINVEISEEDEKLLKENTYDFLAVSYYSSKMVDSTVNKLKPFDGLQNPNLKPTPWEWRADELGFYNCLSQLLYLQLSTVQFIFCLSSIKITS